MEEHPKPKPPTKKSGPKQAEQVKKANFKLKAHLTDRPFSDNALFKQLRDQAKNNHSKEA